MTNSKNLVVWVISMLAITSIGCRAENRIAYTDLVGHLTDLERISTLPEQGEQCMQWSSYDRNSKYDAKTGKYIKWEANGDGNGFIRKEGGKLVMAEMNGPGCIWRIWSATAKNGHVKIYLDGQPNPAVDIPFSGYFDGNYPPFNRPMLVHTAAGNGKNCYIPIPFQKSCKIIADPGYGQYFQFTYTIFPKGTIVPTFNMNLSKEENEALDKANERLSKCGPNWTQYDEQKKVTMTVNVGAGRKQVVFNTAGPAAITSLVVNGPMPDDVNTQRRLLRELTLSIYWDGQAKPGVWCPLGDFFGTAPGINQYRSLPLGIIDNSGYSNWYMPFGKEVKIELANEGQTDVTAQFEITYAPLKRPVEQYGRFHAKWHRDAFPPAEPERKIDWTMLKTTGRGRFCGVELEVWNPRGGWWGEGDEKFFVDGEKFPSTFGTGSEDYFGYAWSSADLFKNCFHNQTICEGNKGHISVNRWQIADNVPFQTSFEGCIEKYWPNEKPTQYSCVVYWYQAAGEQDPYEPVPVDQRVNFYAPITYPLELSGITVLEKPEGRIEEQDMSGYPPAKWKDNNQIWWTGKLGAKMKLAIKVKNDGEFELYTKLTKAPDYGIVQFYLDDVKLGEPIDLFNKDKVTITEDISFGKVHLTPGAHVLTVEMIGANHEAIKAYMFGMDYLRVKPL